MRSVLVVQFVIHPVSQNNAPTLARCSIDRLCLILIIFSKRYQHTFTNDEPIRLSLSVHCCLFYIILNRCNGDVQHAVFAYTYACNLFVSTDQQFVDVL